MATRKPAPKPAAKPTRKPEPRPAPKLAFRTAPKSTSLDLVRNLNFDAAMAQQNYANLMADQQARLAAQQRQYTQGRLMGAPTDQIGFGDVAGTMSSAGQLPSQQQFDPNAPSLMPIETRGSMIGGIGDQQNIYNNLQPYASQVGTVPMRRPEQQMQNYQNFLQQGMQNSNTLNQGAMNNFANMQTGMQAMPPAPSPAPRKFSISNNPSAKAF